ncbi:hypothetical protein Droror1_Dr00011735 [Drosera rotundifolia]
MYHWMENSVASSPETTSQLLSQVRPHEIVDIQPSNEEHQKLMIRNTNTKKTKNTKQKNEASVERTRRWRRVSDRRIGKGIVVVVIGGGKKEGRGRGRIGEIGLGFGSAKDASGEIIGSGDALGGVEGSEPESGLLVRVPDLRRVAIPGTLPYSSVSDLGVYCASVDDLGGDYGGDLHPPVDGDELAREVDVGVGAAEDGSD